MIGWVIDKRFKKFGLADKERFTPDEYTELINRYPKIIELDKVYEEYKKLKRQSPSVPDYTDKLQHLDEEIHDIELEIEELQKEVGKLPELLQSIADSADPKDQLLYSLANDKKEQLLTKIEELTKEIDSKNAKKDEMLQAQKEAEERQQKYQLELAAISNKLLKLVGELGAKLPEEV